MLGLCTSPAAGHLGESGERRSRLTESVVRSMGSAA